jgi:multiple sugar transport system permease protein
MIKNVFKDLSEPQKLRMYHHVKTGNKLLFSILRFVILLSIGYIVIYPLFYMIVTSMASGTAYRNSVRVWIPTELNIKQNYIDAWNAFQYPKTLWNTFKTEIISAVIEICSCAIVGYGMARFDFKLKKVYTVILFLTILVPEMMILIPKVVNYSQLDFVGVLGFVERLTGVDLRPNVLNTAWAFWLPSIFGVGLRSGILIYIYIQFFRGLPRELEEAAWVDGAGPIRTFLNIAIPSSGVVILTVTVFSLIWHWNDSFLSSMYYTGDYPIAVRLDNFAVEIHQRLGIEFNISNPRSASIAMAGCILYIAPMLIFYMIVQRWFIESIDRVGITG